MYNLIDNFFINCVITAPISSGGVVVGPTIIEMWACAQLEEIIRYIEEEWVANDGGLTMAANDAICLATNAKQAIERGDRNWIPEDDNLDANNGVEAEILDIAWKYFWA